MQRSSQVPVPYPRQRASISSARERRSGKGRDIAASQTVPWSSRASIQGANEQDRAKRTV